VGVARIEKPENLTPCARVQAYRHQKYILQFQKWFQQLRHMPQKCPCRNTNPLAQTVYPLQSGKVHPNFENGKKFSEKNLIKPQARNQGGGRSGRTIPRLSAKGPLSQVKESSRACNKIKISFRLSQSLLPNEVADSVRFQI